MQTNPLDLKGIGSRRAVDSMIFQLELGRRVRIERQSMHEFFTSRAVDESDRRIECTESEDCHRRHRKGSLSGEEYGDHANNGQQASG